MNLMEYWNAFQLIVHRPEVTHIYSALKTILDIFLKSVFLMDGFSKLKNLCVSTARNRTSSNRKATLRIQQKH
jgi:hypothetical protein